METLKRPPDVGGPTAAEMRLGAWAARRKNKRLVAEHLFLKIGKQNVITKLDDLEPREVGMRCHGKIHKLRVQIGGRYALLSHDAEEMAALSTLIKLGADPPRCSAVREMLARAERKDYENLHGDLLRIAKVTRMIRRHREERETRKDEFADRGGPASRLIKWKTRVRLVLQKFTWSTPTRMLKYPGIVEIVIGFATKEIEPGVDIRYKLQTDAQMNLKTAGTEVIAAVPFQWPVWLEQGLGIIDAKLVIGVRRESQTIATVQVAEFDEDQAKIVIRERTARAVPDTPRRWVLV